MLTYKINLIRHGMTKANIEGLYLGRTDLPLCDDGIAELEKLKMEYDYPFAEIVYTSPLKRCVQTAYQLYPSTELKVVDDLAECNFGDFEGKSYKDLQYSDDFKAWLEDSVRVSPPNGESGSEFLKRSLRALSDIFNDMLEKGITDASVITHGGVIMMLLSAAGLPRHPMQDWIVENGAGYTIILTPQMWMRDKMFEVFGKIPYKSSEIDDDYDDEQFLYDVENDFDPEKEL